MDPTIDTTEATVLPTGSPSSFLASIGTALLYLIVYPILWLLWLVNTVLIRPTWTIFRFITLPFVKIGQFSLVVLALPVRILAKFEVCNTAVYETFVDLNSLKNLVFPIQMNDSKGCSLEEWLLC
jgi:Sec-independent protein secretion pathway component TatC